jgi:hypothetical protein
MKSQHVELQRSWDFIPTYMAHAAMLDFMPAIGHHFRLVGTRKHGHGKERSAE